MTYAEMLAGRGFKVGDQVICQYRMPCAHQWWVAPLWVGVIEDVSRDKSQWNGSNTEEYYCVALKTVKVRYLDAVTGMPGHTQHDSLANLRQLHFGVETQSPWFSSDASGKRALYEFACRAGMGDLYCDVLRIPPQSAAA